MAGVDLPIAPNLIAGVAGSFSNGSLDTDGHLGEGRFSAGQVGGYARYNADQGLYALATVAYGDFQDKLNRFISIPGLGSGMTHGKFSTDVFSIYGEAGWHYDGAGFATITPYAALSYQDAHADGYTETGFLPLKINSSSSRATSSYLGVSLARTWDDGTTVFTPHLKAAWQHDFTNDAWVMNASFAAVPTVGFGLDGSALSRDSAYINGGLTLGIAQNVDILLDYDGRFSSDQSENSFMARANFKF
jgi:outer membrane autotransporter protein